LEYCLRSGYVANQIWRPLTGSRYEITYISARTHDSPTTLANILLSAIELAILENMVGAFGISILSCLQAEIHELPVKTEVGNPRWPPLPEVYELIT